MSSGPDYYFIRANGDTLHSDPATQQCYVEGEPPGTDHTFFSHFECCVRESIARIGWPDTGDLRHLPAKVGALCRCYEFASLRPHEQAYLLAFRQITVGSVILLPDKARPGVLAIGTVTTPYHYFYQPPLHPYECAHRISVRWDHQAGRTDSPAEYLAEDLGIGISGGFWTRAFHRIDASQRPELLVRIHASRLKNNAAL